MTWNICCLCINNHLMSVLKTPFTSYTLIQYMGKYFWVTECGGRFWMLLTLIRYVFPPRRMLGFAEDGTGSKQICRERILHYFIPPCFEHVYYNILVVFSNSLLFTHVTQADVTIWQTLESSKMVMRVKKRVYLLNLFT